MDLVIPTADGIVIANDDYAPPAKVEPPRQDHLWPRFPEMRLAPEGALDVHL